MATYTPTATEIVHYTKADFRRRPIVEAVHIVQYDDSMPILAVELYSDGLVYQAPSTNTFKIRFGHGDRTFSYVDALGTNADRTIVYFRITPAMTYRFGLKKPVVEMTAGFTFANSSEIPVMIDRNPIQESDEQSYSEYSGIQGMLNAKVDKSAQAAKSSSMTQEVGIDENGKLWSVPGSGGGGGDHSTLTNRDIADQHPISSITNLSSELTGKISKSAQAAKDSTMTQAVGIDSNGKLWSVPGGGSGTSDYDALTNRPQINSVTLTGNKSFEDLGLDTAEIENVSEVEVPLYTVTTAESATATLKNYDTTVLPGTPTAVAVTLPTPNAGNDYLVGLIFKAGASMTFSDTAPTGYAITWDSTPTWTSGKIYEIIYRCLWIADGNSDIIISAKWSEV